MVRLSVSVSASTSPAQPTLCINSHRLDINVILRSDPLKDRSGFSHQTGGSLMRMHYLAIGLLAAIVASSSLAQAAAPALPPATDTVAPEIAGVVKAGTKVQVIKT